MKWMFFLFGDAFEYTPFLFYNPVFCVYRCLGPRSPKGISLGIHVNLRGC